MLYLCSGILLSNKKRITNTCNNVDGPHKHFCSTKEASHKKHTEWFHLYEVLEQTKQSIVTESRSELA